MTEQKANEYLKHMLWCMGNEPPENLTDERDIKEWEDEHRHIRETFEVAIQALEKQIPKKPQLITRTGGIIKFYPCPTCSTSEKYEPVYPKQKYCVECGQKLDWN